MEIELYSKLNDPLSAITQLGKIFAKSGMFGCEREEQGQVLAMICLSEQKSPTEITRNYDIVDGKLRKKSLAALADFRKAGGRQKWIKTGDEAAANEDHREAVGEFTLDGNTVTVRFSMGDAKRQGLVRDKSNWVKTPGNMLRARCASNAVAMLAPEIYAGESDDESVPTITTEKPLLTTDKPTEKPAKEKAAKVIEAEVVTTSEAPKVESTPTPEAPKIVEVKFTAADVRTSPETGKLTVESLAALESAIGESNLPAGIKWLQDRKWIESSLSDLSVERTRRILLKPSEFIGHITKGAK